MRHNWEWVFITAAIAGGLAWGAPPVAPQTAPSSPLQLIWADEFDHAGLPDPAKWTYEEGFVRNNEPQLYMRARRENARVENGHLILEARKEHIPNPYYNPADRKGRKFTEYTSASIVTRGLFDFQYGRVEFRAKLPTAKGTWPAIWTLGENIDKVGWPACGEIDIMEWWGHNPNVMTSTLHYAHDGQHKSLHGELKMPAPITGFHDYALEWYPDHMDFFVDGKSYHHVDLTQCDEQGQNAFRKPHYLMIDLALDPPGRKIDDAALPQQLVVDYIRVYQRKGDGAKSAASRP